MRKDYFGIKSSRNNLNGKHITSMLFFVLLFVFTSQNIFAQGDIFTAATPATNPMDPNGDGFITTTGGLFTGAPTLEESEFEITYIELPNFGTEPDGDLQTGANCGSTEIVENTANSSNGSYYYISDPDGIPDNGDELMLFRMRIAQNPSGAFGYSFLVDTDNLFGFAGVTADPNAIAGNPGFEIEVVLGIQGGGAGVNVFNVDGTTSGSSINSYPLSSNYQRVNALDNDPDCGPGAIFFDFYVPLTDVVPSVASSFRLVAATSSSASSALGGSASDISGVDGLLIPADDDQFEAAISAYGAAAAPEIDVLGNAISIIGDGTNTPNLADGTDFGQIATLTNSAEQLFIIENTGTSDLTLNPSFTSNPAFTITTPAVSPVAAGGSTTIGVTFTAPGALGVVNAQLFITNNDADESPAYIINLRGESIAPAPEIDVLGNTISIIGDGTNTPNLADGTDFGQVVTGTSSVEQLFTIENTGTLPLNVGPSFTTNLPVFSITTSPVSPVPAGGSTTIGITFNAPGSLGVENAQLFITNNDPDEQPVYTINLQGESVPPPPEIDVLGNGISIIGDGTNVPNLSDGTDFGSVAQGTASVERFFIIQNTGLGPLSVNPSFSSDPNFAITTPAVSPVPSGGSTTIGITFNAPATLGAQTATIFITNDDSDENPYQINLIATSILDTDGDGIADINDIDDDNDGILDTTEGVVDTDGDGVINSLDLDSDNDGIADLVENGGADANNDGMIDGFTDLNENGLHDGVENTELYGQDNAASLETEINSVGSWITGAGSSVVTSDNSTSIDGIYSIKIVSIDGSNDRAEYSFPTIPGNTYEFIVWAKRGVVDGGQNLDNGPGFIITQVNITSTEWTKYVFTATATAASGVLRAYSSDSGGAIGDELFIDKISVRETLQQVPIDTDSDTIPDYLDLDSDNDGIPDNIEAQATLAYIGPNSTFDLNGVDTAYTTLLTPIDSDADTTPDYIDLDSDNEGADDTTEAALTLSGTVGNNGLDTNSETADDYSDVNGIFDDPQNDFPDTDNDLAFGGDVDFRDAFFAPDKDGDGVPDIGDLDDDNDGIPDVAETGGQDPSVDGDGDNVPFYLDDDDSNPAVGDDDGLIQPGFDLDGDLIANHLDLDADNDGIFDLHEAGHTELDVDFNGEIDGVPADFGANGLFNAIESDDTPAATITYTLLDSDGDSAINALDVDDDGDGVNTEFEVDNADLDGDPTTGVVIDTDLDTILDYLDIDDDGDGVNTIFEVDNADLDGDPTTGVVIDSDSDTILDYLDIDDDGDSVNTIFEVDNADLDGDPTTGVVIDTDLDTILDYLDADDDGDSINTEFEVDNADADGDPTTGVIIDSDGDTILNYLDPDDDGDGIDTINENPDPNGDGDPIDAEDKDGDGIPNYLDLDSDNDGILDSVELAIDTDGDGVENYVDLDSDNDGIFDVVEAGHDTFDSDFDGVIDTLISVGVNGLFDALETFPDSGILNPIYDPIDSTTAAGVPAPDGIFDFLELDSDTDGCNDVTEAGYTDGDSDGLLGTSPVATDANGLVTSAIDGYTIPNDTDVNGTFDFQEYSETTSITTQPVTPPPTIAGGTVNIDITSNANTFQWEVSTTGVAGPYTPIANDANYSGVATANLIISNIPLSFDGYFYRVQISTNNFLCDLPLISDAVEVTVLQDNDGDLIPDVTDLDDDNDGIPDTDEGGDALDTDGDGVPNRFDLDSDNDGIYDLVESGQIDAANNVVDVNNDGIIDAANAGTVGANGIFDPLENAPDSGVLANATADSDTDGIVDSNEINADDDGCNDVIEAGFTDPDANGFLGNGTPGAGLVTDANGVVTGQGGYTTPDDNDSNGTYDFQEPGEQVVLSSQPLSQVVVINATANFDVTGTSPVYTWYESTDGGFNWVILTNGGTNPTVTGANTDTLTLTNVPGSYDGNQYRVVLSSPAYACGGNITSNSALLTVYADFDGDGIGDPVDLDDDNDGIPDTVETGGIDPTSDNDGDGVPVYLDDNDNNISVGNDNGIVEPAFDFDGDGLANHLELDADNDGVYDTNEAGFADLDLDNNGVVDGIPADFGANGLLDSLETAPESGLINYTPLNTDSDTRLNFIDRDDDADGVNTQYENPDADSNGDPSDAQDTDSDGTPDYLDIDDDADGVYTSFEGVNPDGDGNPNTGSTRDTDNDTVFNYLDIDDDGDSVNTVFEGVNPDGDGNPSTGATLNTDGDGLLNYLDTDDDGDSIPTIFENPDANNDGDPADAQDTDGDLIPDYLDNDDDDDTILTFFENPDPDGNGDPLDAQDSDGNGVPDYLDNDDDGDGVLTELENPDPNGNGNPADAQDTDGDGTPDYLDVDDDGDGILTLDEDVDGDGDPTNDDSDADGVPNYLDIDDDNDGIITLTEGPGNVDGDSYPNYLDQDADGDGIPDNVEGQLTLSYVLPAGDSDGNGLDDAYEATPGSGGGIIPVNTDGADNPDYLDSDSDNDNVPDSIEGHNFLAQFDPDVLPSGNDVDGDGLDDAYDGAVGSFLDPNGLTVIDNPATDLPNFDSTDEVNFRDTDDDNDGINTIDEDGDLSGDPIYDDCDEDGNPDYVDIIPCDRIPTGFSPNDDGNNDTLVVPALAQYKDFTMEVYDRWGNIVYEYNNNGREQPLWWDGFSTGTRTINKGEKVPVGTYFYVIEFNQDRIPPRSGWVYVNY